MLLLLNHIVIFNLCYVYLFKAIEQMVSGFLIHLQKWNAKYCPITHFSVYKRLATEKEWITGNNYWNRRFIELSACIQHKANYIFSVNENITPNGIFSVETLNPSTNYNILVKCFNSAGMTSTIYTATTLTNYGGSSI